MQAQAVSGNVYTADGEAMESIMVTVNDDMSNASETFNDGSYRFWELPDADSYSIKPHKVEANVLNGVSTYDLVLITRHILGIQSFETSFQMVAADYDASGTITTFDVINLRRLILRMDQDFRYTDAWRFVDANFDFEGISRTSIPEFPEERMLEAVVAGQASVDFVGIKMGDVNNSANPNSLSTIDERNSNELYLSATPQLFDNNYTFTVSAADFNNLSTMQFTLHFDANQLDFQGINSLNLSGLSKDNLGLQDIENGIITFSWMDIEGLTLAKDTDLFELNFTVKNRVPNASLILNSSLTPAIAHDTAGIPLKISLQNTLPATVAVVAITPNPVRHSAILTFATETTENAILKLYSLDGKLLQTYEQTAFAGQNEFQIQRAQLATTTAVVYQLQVGTQIQQGRIVLVD